MYTSWKWRDLYTVDHLASALTKREDKKENKARKRAPELILPNNLPAASASTLTTWREMIPCGCAHG